LPLLALVIAEVDMCAVLALVLLASIAAETPYRELMVFIAAKIS
jgi:hypothetical protein